MPTALVTGSAGFIGFHCCQRLLQDGYDVVGLDAMTDYYDVSLKEARHAMLAEHATFRAVIGAVETPELMMSLMAETRPDVVIHLAAQAGVRYSIDNPRSYLESNLVGTFEVLEAARAFPPRHMLLASTSSAYGSNTDMPYRETQKADHQMSFYAATKKATENMAHSYAHLYDLPVTMFRFFTVYGPWGRPDMALFKFARAILADEPIEIYNHGEMKRDFTYIDDLVTAIRLLIDAIPPRPAAAPAAADGDRDGGGGGNGDSLSPVAPWRVVNIGNSQAVQLMDYIAALETALGREAQKTFLPMQAGDVPATCADTTLLTKLTGFSPNTSVTEGVARFVDWYLPYASGGPR